MFFANIFNRELLDVDSRSDLFLDMLDVTVLYRIVFYTVNESDSFHVVDALELPHRHIAVDVESVSVDEFDGCASRLKQKLYR